ncbi:MAG: hypothetical protein KDB22_29460 [Planctomycetales bacterium]|nr:hypothetical protein [Planctomycetales bacterium]
MQEWILALSLICLVAGCSSGVPTAEVEGVVTLDGKPLADIRVLFQPANTDAETAGMGSFALTDAEGKFTLKLSDSQENGAVVGKHTVVLSDKLSEDPEDSDAGAARVPKSRIPARYAKQPLSFEVKAGEKNQADLALTSK